MTGSDLYVVQNIVAPPGTAAYRMPKLPEFPNGGTLY